MTRTGRRAPPGGHDHVSALIHNSTPQTSRPVSKNALKQTYAEELRAQIAQQNRARKEEADLYHSRPVAQRTHGNQLRINEPSSPQADTMSYGLRPNEHLPQSPTAAETYDPHGLSAYGHHPHAAALPPPHPSSYALHQPAPAPAHYSSYYSPPQAPPRYEYYQPHAQLPPHPPGMYSSIPQHLPPSQPGQSIFPPAAATMYPQQAHHQHQARPASPTSPDAMPFGKATSPPHRYDHAAPDQQENRPHPQNNGIMGFLRSDSKLSNRKEEQKAAYRAELEAQMQQTRDARRRQKQAELEEDRRMLSALRASDGRSKANIRSSVSPTGRSPPAAHTHAAFCPDPDYSGGAAEPEYGITAMPAAYSALNGTMATGRGQTGFADGAAGQQTGYGAYTRGPGEPGAVEAAGRVSPGVGVPSAAAAAAANGGVVPRGVLVNMESALGETPTLHFKSDKAFLTPAEMAARAAAATTLQQALAEQIAEKTRRKEAEKRAEKERDEAEMRRIKREQEELERKQRSELDCERNPGGPDAARDEVAEAWRRAQEEAATAKRQHGGRGGAATVRTSPEDRRKSLRGISERSRAERGAPGAGRPEGGHHVQPAPWADDRYEGRQERQPAGRTLQIAPGPAELLAPPPYPSAGAGYGQSVGAGGEFEQARMAMAADNERMRAQLATQTADIAALRHRADEYERQSRAAQAELSDARQRLHASAAARSELDTFAAALPEPPPRYDYAPGYRSHAQAGPRELEAGSSFMAADAGSIAAEASHPYHPSRDRGFLPDLHDGRGGACRPGKAAPDRGGNSEAAGLPHVTCRRGFLSDLPPPAARQRGAATATPTPRQSQRHGGGARAFAQQLLEDDSPALVAQTQFIPVSAARAPLEPDIQLRHGPRARTPRDPPPTHRARGYDPLPPLSSRHTSPGPQAPASRFTRHHLTDGPRPERYRQPQPAAAPQESPGKELTAVSSFLDDGGAHMRSTEQLAMLQRLRLDGPVADSVEALDDFLAGFVNEGNAAAPLYSSVHRLSPERVLAESEARCKLLARRPSDMSVSGVTLQQVQQTTADALSTMAAAEAALQPPGAPAARQTGEHAAVVGSAAGSSGADAADVMARGAVPLEGTAGLHDGQQAAPAGEWGGDVEAVAEQERPEGLTDSRMTLSDDRDSETSAETLESIDVESGERGGDHGEGVDGERVHRARDMAETEEGHGSDSVSDQEDGRLSDSERQ